MSWSSSVLDVTRNEKKFYALLADTLESNPQSKYFEQCDENTTTIIKMQNMLFTLKLHKHYKENCLSVAIAKHHIRIKKWIPCHKTKL